MVTYDDIAELVLGDVKETLDDLEKRYPPRNLKEGAAVTRFAPSPTGFLHTGSLFTAMIAYTTAKTTGGVYIFRLEDTDTKRTIEGSDKDLVRQLLEYGLVPSEGYYPEGDEGDYGPYRQSLRANIYKVAVKALLKRGRAYVDFATPEDLAAIKKAQEESKVLPGYYGVYARDRNLPLEEVKARVEAGEPYVIRYKSEGDHNLKTSFDDLIRGHIELQDNDMDIVILKRDGLPTYHFAHVVDDHFMRTTIVSRGEEWIPSTPVHLQLFKDMGWEAPRYAHLPVIMKLDHGNKRKLSKRKDPEASVGYFMEQGYPPKAVLVYLMSIANSNFEEWSMENGYDLSKFPFSFEKMSLDGALFDMDKLTYFSKEILAREKGMPLVEAVTSWAKEHSPVLLEKINRDPSYFSKVLDIEKERQNPRKDYAKYSDIEASTRFFYDDEFEKIVAAGLPFNEKYDRAFVASFLLKLRDGMYYGDDESMWWNSVKEIAGQEGFALNNKEYKANPEAYKGNAADAAELLRIALTGSKNSPNLHEVISILGEERTKARLSLEG